MYKDKIHSHHVLPTFVSVEDYEKIMNRLDIIVDMLMLFRPDELDTRTIQRLVEGVAARLIECPTLEECE